MKLQKKLKLQFKLSSAVVLAGLSCLLPLSVTKDHEIDFRSPTTVKLTQSLQSSHLAPLGTLEGIYTAPAVLPSDHLAIARAAGISDSDLFYVNFIIGNESGWCSTKWQGTHDCPDSYQPTGSLYDTWEGYGLCQSTPGIKMSAEGGNWQSDPITQLKWCSTYVQNRYGSWAGAYNYWQVHHNF